MKHIYIPTDFSPNAQRATDYGLELFNGTDYRITLLHTLYVPVIEAGAEFNRNGFDQKNAEKKFAAELERIQQKFPEHKAPIHFRFELGDVVNVVEFILESEEIYALVMGTKGSSNSRDKLMGSRTSHMVKHIAIPIFVIPADAVFKAIKKVLITTDLELIPLDQSLKLVKDLCTRHNAYIDLLHVNQKDADGNDHKEIKEKLSELIYPIKHFFISVDNVDISDGIFNYLVNAQPDLLISVNKERGFFQNLFHKSVTKELILQTDMPLLVINGQDFTN